MMYFFRFNLLALVLLALLSVCIARPSPSSLKTIASSTNSKSSIKSPSQKIAEKNNLAPSVASIVEASQSVSQESVANINTPQSQDPESLNYSSKDVVHNSQSNVVSTSLTEDGLVKPSANLNVQSEAPVVAKNQEALVAEAATVNQVVPVVQSAPQIVQPAPVNQVVPVVQPAPAPVVQATPIVQSAPQIVQPAPVNQVVPVVQSAPQIVQPAPVNQVVPVVQSDPALVVQATPVVQSAPQIVQPAPVNQVVPVVQSAPQIVQPAPVNQVVPVVQSAPALVVQATPVVQSAPQIVQPAPVNQAAPVVQSAPQIVQPAPVNQAAPVVSEVDNKEVLQSDLSSYNKPI